MDSLGMPAIYALPKWIRAPYNGNDKQEKPMKLLLIIAALLSGCASVGRVVVMQHPETKQTVYCQGTGAVGVSHGALLNSCMNAHAMAGYVKVTDSGD